jgi:hypothetical protein
MQYIPYEELGNVPNIIVDGAANAHTVLTLSHWPKSATPADLKDDLSAQIVFRYLDRPDLNVDLEAVSNNHFDQDGLVSVYALVHPSDAAKRRALLIDIAAAGDFGTYRLREAARASFVLDAFADPERSPLDGAIFKRSYPKMASGLYRELLPKLPEILSNIDRFRNYWEAEDAALTASETMIRDGRIRIEEFPNLDLAIVTLPQSLNGQTACHPMAVNNVLTTFRVLTIQGRNYELQYRYESWVEYVSQPVPARIDLTPLAQALSESEAGHGEWEFDGVDEISPKLVLTGADESRIPPGEFAARIKSFLAKPFLQ